MLPLRRWQAREDRELADYLHWLAQRAEVIVVDGSADEIFAAHRRCFDSTIRHVPVDTDLAGRYGKVNGVITGVRAATHDRVVIADDDVRYGEEQLVRLCQLLERHHLVRPQNYFDPLPWHARWDTGRSLLNRAVGADFPGTMGLRRSAFLAAGGYDGDCLFENLELIRTVQAAGGSVASARDLFVRRLPPTARRFATQRIRQAYDDFALPGRLASELVVLPATAWAVHRRRFGVVAGGVAAVAAVAEVGRRRDGGRSVYPSSAALWAPAWVAERAVCIWLALANRLAFGGVPYAGTVLRKSATRPRVLRRQLAGRLLDGLANPAESAYQRESLTQPAGCWWCHNGGQSAIPSSPRQGRIATISPTGLSQNAFRAEPQAGAIHQREIILARRADTLARLDQLSMAVAELEGESQALDLPDEEDLGEANGALVERDRLLALASAARLTLAEMDAALARLDAGAYGTCVACAQPIPPARLEAVPEATHCVGCKTGGLRARA